MRILHKLNTKIVTIIEHLDFKKVIIIYSLFFILGRYVNIFYQFRFSFIHQINLSIISCIVLSVLHTFYNITSSLEKEFCGKNPFLHIEFRKLNNRISSVWNIILPFLLCGVFCFVIFYLNYLPLNLMGIFGAIMASSAFFFSLMAYYAFVNSMLCIFALQKKDADSLPFTYPDDIKNTPRWIKALQELFRISQISIFAVGTLFTLEYVLLVPIDSIQFTPIFKINSNHPIIFLYNWVIIAVFVIVACPIMLFITKKYLNRLLGKIYSQAKKHMDAIFYEESLSINTLLYYQQVLKNLKSSDMYAIKNQALYPIAGTTISIALNLIKLFEAYLFPILRNSI